MIKVPNWVLFLLPLVVRPILVKLADALDEQAKKTPENWDDILAGAFRTVVDALGTEGLFTPKGK